MARFPHYKSNVIELGRLLARASLDESVREALVSSPQEALAQIGLPKHATSLMTFKVVDQRLQENAVVLPYKLNDDKLASNIAGYAEDLGKHFALN
ncbi:hypothetical protein CHH27_04735 [Labrenzia sp. VG12]|nr:hypothetical protein CHH27_04735 [Labrenzia sp. VG12]